MFAQPFDQVKVFQIVEDKSWNTTRDSYLNACRNWVTENVRNRELGLPLTPVPIIPLHRIYSRDANNQIQSQMVHDSSLTVPSLPPIVANSPNQEFQTGDMNGTIINLLMSLINQVSQLQQTLNSLTGK